jgi:Tol biopolymer transport system component
MVTKHWRFSNLWLASAIVLGLAGCASTAKPTDATAKSVSAQNASSAARANTSAADDFDSFNSTGTSPDAPAAAPPVVNVFGELNGIARGPGKLVGDEGFQQHTFTDEGYDADVSVDVTGKWMVFASTRHSAHAGIYLQRVDGTAVTKLTSDDSDNAFPSFSPDGKQIAFCSTRAGAWNIYVMDTEGRNNITITSGSTQCIHPSFSPDGSRLVYCALGARSNQWELWTIDLATSERRQIGYGLFPAWSPQRDVDRIAFQRARQRGSRWFSLWTLDLIDGEAHRVTEVAVSSNAAIVSPSWSPDGKRLVFATILDPNRNSQKTAAPARGEQDIWTVDVDGNDRQRITDGNGINLSPFWSKDNRVYFISNRSGNESIWSVRPSSGNTFTAQAPKTDKSREVVGSVDTKDADK